MISSLLFNSVENCCLNEFSRFCFSKAAIFTLFAKSSLSFSILLMASETLIFFSNSVFLLLACKTIISLSFFAISSCVIFLRSASANLTAFSFSFSA